MELIIPDFSFIEAGGHEKTNVLKGRNVVFHCTSMSVVEMLCTDDMDVLLNEGTPRLNSIMTTFLVNVNISLQPLACA